MDTYNREHVLDMIEELREYAEMECSEMGELWQSLGDMESVSHYASDEFKFALAKEIEAQYDYIKAHAVVETKTVERTHNVTITELVWNDE